ncbi:MAG: hypothetical protein HS116_19350 [Planctomycetes bacterium]|nr:hypothetical protein [Planctomycetota bacterium]
MGKILQSALKGLVTAYGDPSLADKTAAESQFIGRIVEAIIYRRLYYSAIDGDSTIPLLPTTWAEVMPAEKEILPALLEKAAEDVIDSMFTVGGDASREKLWERLSWDLSALKVAYPRANLLVQG